MDTASISSKVMRNYDAGTPYPDTKSDHKYLTIAAVAVFIILIITNICRISYNNFWGDEVYSIDVAHMTYSEIVDYAINVDSHPPLYNLYLSLLCQTFGFNPLVYHISATLPYVGMMVIGITFVRRNFGSVSSIMFMVLATMMVASFYYINESRMYELGAFLVLLSFVAAYYVMMDGSTKWYVLLAISSLAASYTHYYCLLACVILFASLFIFFFIEKRSELKRFVPVGLITVVGYLPWAIIALINTVSRDTKDFWITDTMSVLDCAGNLFTGILAWPLLIIFFIAITVMLKRNYQSSSKKYHQTESAWAIIGIACIFYSIMFVVILSILTRPIIIARYLYPVSVIAWLLLSITVSRLNCFKIKRIKLSAIIVSLIVIVSVPVFCISMCQEYNDDQSTQNIVSCVDDNTADGDTILTNNWQLYNNVCNYYFNELRTVDIGSDLPALDHSEHYILMLDDSMNISSYEQQLAKQGFFSEKLTGGSFAKDYDIIVYELIPGNSIHLA